MKQRKLRIPDQLQPFLIDPSKYRRVRELGIGGQGRVYLVVDSKGHQLALKEIIPDEKPKHQAKRFMSEVAALYRAQHPYVLKLVGFSNEVPYTLVTDYVAGPDLFMYVRDMRGGAQENGTKLTIIAMAIANAMCFLHKSGIMHRDLKGKNVLIGPDSMPHLCDFGLIREADKDTPITAIIGTPNYMAPEVINAEDNEENYTNKCDVFSYAMVLYEMATRKRPFQDLKTDAIIYLIGNRDARPEFPVSVKINDNLKKLIKKCWDKDPEVRYSFDKIFNLFADGKVYFDGTESQKVSDMAKEMRKMDQKRRVVPPIDVFGEQQEIVKSKSNQHLSEKKKEKYRQYLKESHKRHRHKHRIRRRHSNDAKSSDLSDDDNSSPSEKFEKQIKTMKLKKKRRPTSESGEEIPQKPFKLSTQKQVDKEERFNFKLSPKKEKRSSSSYRDLPKRSFKLQDRAKEYDNSSYSSSDPILDSNKRKKNDLISSSGSFDVGLPPPPKHDPYEKTKVLAPSLHMSTAVKQSKKHPPTFHPPQDESSSSLDSEDIDDGAQFIPLQSPAYAAKTPINFTILYDIENPLFNTELAKVSLVNIKPEQYGKFFAIVLNHLRSKTPKNIVRAFLTTSADLLKDQRAIKAFSENGVQRYLPVDDTELSEQVCDILDILFATTPEIFQSNFQPSMVTLINLYPQRAIQLLILYAKSFDKIENPWPILDLLIKQKKKFYKSKASKDYVSLLYYLVTVHPSYYKARFKDTRPIFTMFLTSSDTETSITAYNAVTALYDHEFDIPFDLIMKDLLEPDLTEFAVSLLTVVDEIPPVEEIIYPLVRAARCNEEAYTCLVKMVKAGSETADILLSKPKWIQYKLPTYRSTMNLIILIIKYQDLVTRVADCKEMSVLMSLAAETNEPQIYSMYEKLFNKIPFGETFIQNLHENSFFVNFFRGIVEINDEIITISALRVIALVSRIGFTSDYLLFTSTLKKFLSEEGDVSRFAVYALYELSYHPRCATQYAKHNLIKKLKKIKVLEEDRRVVSKLVRNISATTEN